MPRKKVPIVLRAALTVFVFLAAAVPVLAGSKEEVLHNFGTSKDGNIPEANLIFDTAGNLYGTTVGGDAYGYGTVFELSLSANKWTKKILHSFNNSGKDGVAPDTGLVFDQAGNLYGTTPEGGKVATNCTSGCGWFLDPILGELTRGAFGSNDDTLAITAPSVTAEFQVKAAERSRRRGTPWVSSRCRQQHTPISKRIHRA